MVKINREAFERLQAQYDMNDTELAHKMGINRTQVWRVKAGKNDPGTDFVAGALRAFPGVKFDELFILPDVVQARITQPTGTDNQ